MEMTGRGMNGRAMFMMEKRGGEIVVSRFSTTMEE